MTDNLMNSSRKNRIFGSVWIASNKAHIFNLFGPPVNFSAVCFIYVEQTPDENSCLLLGGNDGWELTDCIACGIGILYHRFT
jgi:hypothetical protein